MIGSDHDRLPFAWMDDADWDRMFWRGDDGPAWWDDWRTRPPVRVTFV